VRGLLETVKMPEASGTWWRDAFIPGQLLAFAVVFGATEGEAPSDAPVGRMLFHIRNYFRAEQGANAHPSELDTDRVDLLPYARDHYFTFSSEGGGFFGGNLPPTHFFQNDLPSHLRDQYFLLYLLALLQRFALLRLSREVSDRWLDGNVRNRVAAFAEMDERFLEFTARGHFALASQRGHHQRFYRKWLETLRVERLYDEVAAEIRSMASYCQRWTAQEIEHSQRLLATMLGAVGLFLGAPSLIVAVMALPMRGWQDRGGWLVEEILWWAFGVGWACSAILFGGWWLARLARRRKRLLGDQRPPA
jgi:hypothetical protein